MTLIRCDRNALDLLFISRPAIWGSHVQERVRACPTSVNYHFQNLDINLGGLSYHFSCCWVRHFNAYILNLIAKLSSISFYNWVRVQNMCVILFRNNKAYFGCLGTSSDAFGSHNGCRSKVFLRQIWRHVTRCKRTCIQMPSIVVFPLLSKTSIRYVWFVCNPQYNFQGYWRNSKHYHSPKLEILYMQQLEFSSWFNTTITHPLALEYTRKMQHKMFANGSMKLI